MSEISSESDTLRGKVVSVGHHLHDTRAERNKYKDLHVELVTALFGLKAEAEALVSLHKADVVAINAQARKVSEEAELQLTRAVEHAWLESQRQALVNIHAWGIDLSAEIERVKTLEEEVAALFASEGELSSDLDDEDKGEILERKEAV